MSDTEGEEPVADNKDVEDHTRSYTRGDENLTYLYDKGPESTEVIEVAKGILWARVSLPWGLDHINVYLLDEGNGWTIVDTGINSKVSRAIWRKLEKTVLGGKPILNVIATHLHPDHMGLAGWLVERHSAKFYMTMGEYLMGQMIWRTASKYVPDHDLDFYFKAGIDRKYEDAIRNSGYSRFKKIVYKLPDVYTRLEDGTQHTFGGRRWQVVVGRGHSPEHACLLCLDEPILISGDQVLPDITSNVSVVPRMPELNPLAYWISCIDRMRAIDSDPIVLPSHGGVFKGLHERLDTLLESHIRKLSGLHEFCKTNTPHSIGTFKALYRRKISGPETSLALGEAVAHIHLLESLGCLERRLDGEVFRFSAIGSFNGDTLIDDVNKLPGVALRPLADMLA